MQVGQDICAYEDKKWSSSVRREHKKVSRIRRVLIDSVPEIRVRWDSCSDL